MDEKRYVSSSESLVRRNRTFFVGLFIAIPAVLIPILLFFTLLKTDMFQRWCRLSIITENSMGLNKGSQVTISGMEIGYVYKVDLDREGHITVNFKIRDQYRQLVRKDSQALLKQKNFVVCDWEIELTRGSPSTPAIADGDTMNWNMPLRIDKMIEQVTTMVGAVGQILDQVLAGKGSVGRLLMEDTLVNMLQQIGSNTMQLTHQTSGTINKAGELITGINQVSSGGQRLLDSVMNVIATVNTTLDGVQKILLDVKSTSGELPSMLSQVRDDVGEAEMMMRGLQKNWLLKKALGKQQDPLLGNDP